MPTWLLLALLAPVLFASVNCLEKVVVDRSRTSIYHYVAWVGACDGLIGVVVLGAVSGQGVDGRAYLGGWLSGTMVSVSLVLYLVALRLGQVTRVIPVWYLNPLMVAPMAAVFLGERISLLAVVAVVLAVVGGVLVSWQGGKGSRSFGNPFPVLLALAAAVFMAVSIVLAKEFLESDSFWQFFGTYHRHALDLRPPPSSKRARRRTEKPQFHGNGHRGGAARERVVDRPQRCHQPGTCLLGGRGRLRPADRCVPLLAAPGSPPAIAVQPLDRGQNNQAPGGRHRRHNRGSRDYLVAVVRPARLPVEGMIKETRKPRANRADAK